jgi:capsular polysaccharide biosynthesis protein
VSLFSTGTSQAGRSSLFPAIGLLCGLLFGVGLVYLRESQDDTVADSFKIEELAHVPVIALIPYHRKDGTKRNRIYG